MRIFSYRKLVSVTLFLSSSTLLIVLLKDQQRDVADDSRNLKSNLPMYNRKEQQPNIVIKPEDQIEPFIPIKENLKSQVSKEWPWQLDKQLLGKCLEIKQNNIDIYLKGRSHEKERPFPSFVPAFVAPPLETSKRNMVYQNPNTTNPIPEYSSKEAETLITCLRDFNEESMKSLEKSIESTGWLGNKRPILPIVIVCHNRASYLANLIDSITTNIGIEQTLIVFSHDGYFPAVQTVIEEKMQAVRNTIKYVQFFMPFSRNWLGHSFFLHLPFFEPGVARHHYYWLWNFMFDVVLPRLDAKLGWDADSSQLRVTTLEEDHIVSTDFYQMIKLMVEVIEPLQSVNSIFSLSGGTISDYPVLSEQALDAFEHNTVQNAGLCLSKAMFEKIRKGPPTQPKQRTNSEEKSDPPPPTFCHFNEYNWDWAFFRMTQYLVPGASIVPVVSRVVHAGGCGLHFRDSSCDDLYKRMRSKYLDPLNELIATSAESPLTKNLYFTHNENYTNIKADSQRRSHYRERVIGWRVGRTDSRSMLLHQGFEGWTSGIVSDESRNTLLLADLMIPSDGSNWFSPFHEMLCLRMERMYRTP